MYCSVEDIEKQITHETLVQLTNDNSLPEVDEAVTFEAILYSSTLIDGYLRGRYNLPLDTHLSPIPILRIIAIDLSIYRLYSRRLQADMPESILAQYKETIKTLDKIQKGTITLELENSQETLQNNEYLTNKNSNDRMFSHEVLNGY